MKFFKKEKNMEKIIWPTQIWKKSIKKNNIQYKKEKNI